MRRGARRQPGTRKPDPAAGRAGRCGGCQACGSRRGGLSEAAAATAASAAATEAATTAEATAAKATAMAAATGGGEAAEDLRGGVQHVEEAVAAALQRASGGVTDIL